MALQAECIHHHQARHACMGRKTDRCGCYCGDVRVGRYVSSRSESFCSQFSAVYMSFHRLGSNSRQALAPLHVAAVVAHTHIRQNHNQRGGPQYTQAASNANPSSRDHREHVCHLSLSSAADCKDCAKVPVCDRAVGLPLSGSRRVTGRENVLETPFDHLYQEFERTAAL